MKLLKRIRNYINRQLRTKFKKRNPETKINNVYCTCCSKSFNAFLPFGLIRRENALCPGCGSLERHRLHFHYMVNETNLFKSAVTLKILHVAPEKVFYDKFYNNRKFDYVPCAKLGEEYTNQYPAGTLNVDITEMEFQDNSFDVIYCSHVLEHVPNDIKAMRELLRVLKPGGWAMLQVPVDINRDKTYEDFSIIDPGEKEKAFGQYDHVRVYGKDYKERLELAGFNLKVENYPGEFTEDEIFKLGFMKDEKLYICTKN